MSRSNTATLEQPFQPVRADPTSSGGRSPRWRGFVLVGALALAIAALSTWNVADPSFFLCNFERADQPARLWRRRLRGHLHAVLRPCERRGAAAGRRLGSRSHPRHAFRQGGQAARPVVRRLGAGERGLDCVPAPSPGRCERPRRRLRRHDPAFSALFTEPSRRAPSRPYSPASFTAPAAWCPSSAPASSASARMKKQNRHRSLHPASAHQYATNSKRKTKKAPLRC